MGRFLKIMAIIAFCVAVFIFVRQSLLNSDNDSSVIYTNFDTIVFNQDTIIIERYDTVVIENTTTRVDSVFINDTVIMQSEPVAGFPQYAIEQLRYQNANRAIPLALDSVLCDAAEAHAEYIERYWDDIIANNENVHIEDMGRYSATGRDIRNRIRFQSGDYSASTFYEVVVVLPTTPGHQFHIPDCVDVQEVTDEIFRRMGVGISDRFFVIVFSD